MNRSTLETTIRTRIEEALPDAEVAEYPDNLESFNPKRNKSIIVGYSGKIVLSNDNGYSTRRRDQLTIIVTYMYKARRNRDGILDDLERVENMLSGYEIGTAHLKFEDEQFTGYRESSNRWLYNQKYTILDRFDNTNFIP